MTFRIFNNLKLVMPDTTDPDRSNLLQRRWWASKNLCIELTFNIKASHLGKNLPLLQRLKIFCPNWTNTTEKKVTAKLCQNKMGKFFKIFCFSEVSVINTRPVGQRQMFECFRTTMEVCPERLMFALLGNIISFLGIWWS